MRSLLISALHFAFAAASPAAALCSGASVEREFGEADLVIRARLVSETNSWSDDPSPRYRAHWGEASAVLYGLRVSETFKGSAPARINLFQERNSGAFYLDPDRDYLLFLNRIPAWPGRPLVAAGAYYVRYACGQSKRWDEVRPADLRVVRSLSTRRETAR